MSGKYPPECEVHGCKMHLEPIGRGKTAWICDECEAGHQALFRAVFGPPRATELELDSILKRRPNGGFE